MHAAKHFDPQIGIDIHMTMLGPFGPFPLPTAHLGIVLDPFDYIPIIGGTVQVNGVKRATAGTGGLDLHIPLGIWMPPAELPAGPQWDDEIFMGSMTVVADGDPLSRIAMPVLDCNIVGLINPFRLRKPKKPQLSMSLPTAVNLAIPNTVFVGGPPMISIMGMAFKGAFATLGRLARTKFAQRIFEGAKGKWSKLFANMEPGFLKCKVLRAEPVDIRTGAVSVSHEDFSIPGRLPLAWTRRYRSDAVDGAGVCGWGWSTPADIRLEVGHDGIVSVPVQGPPALYERLPLPGEVLFDPIDGARLARHRGALGDELHLRTKDELVYVFAMPPADAIESPGQPPCPLRLERLEDRCGNGWTFERDGEHLTRIVEKGLPDSPGRFIEVGAQAGRIHAMTLHDPISGASFPLVRYRQDASGDLVAALDALGAARTFDYRADHRMVRHTDRVGLSFHYAYDAQARVVHSWGDGGLYDYRFAYHDALLETEVTDSLGHVSLVRFDTTGLPLCEIDPLGGCTFFEYDEWGRTTALTDPNGLRTAFEYDARGNLTALTRADDGVMRATYDDEDKVVRITDPCGASWRQQWDERGLMVSQTSPLGATTRLAYDAHGLLVSHKNPRGAVTSIAYSAHGLPSALTDPMGCVTRFQHDALGSLLVRTDAAGHVVRYRHDAKGRLVAVEPAQGRGVSFGYDAEDQVLSHVDENGHLTRLEYTGLRQLARRVQPDGHCVGYRYDTEERLVGVVDQRGELYQLVRDPLGRVVREVDYWGQERRHAYDPGGRLLHTIDPLGQVIGYRIDPLGRITRRTWPDARMAGSTVTEEFRYDRNGRLVWAANEVARLSRTYDAEGRMTEEVVNGFKVCSRYDEAGNRVERRTSAGNVVEVEHDLMDRPQTLRINGGFGIRIQRDACGQATVEQLGDHLQRRFSYRHDGMQTRQALARDDQALWETTFEYDPAGNMTRRLDSHVGGVAFTYDPMGRIQSHTDPEGRLTRFVLDPTGARLHTQVREWQPARLVGGADTAAEWSREGTFGNLQVAFDRAGSMVRRRYLDQPGQPSLHLQWDAQQRLVRSRWDGGDRDGLSTTYGYDPLGRRVLKQEASGTTRFFWDRDVMVAELGQDERPGLHPTGAQVIDLQAVRSRADTAQAAFRRAREYIHRPTTCEPLAIIEPTDQPAPSVITLAPAPSAARPSSTAAASDAARPGPHTAGDRRPGLEFGQLGLSARLEGRDPQPDAPAPSAPAPAVAPTGQAADPDVRADPRIYLYHNDPNGQPTRVTTSTGGLVWRAAAAVADGSRPPGCAFHQPIRLQGQYEDEDTGLRYNAARYYDPVTDAFVTQDPLRLAPSESLYAYGPNIHRWADASGLSCADLKKILDDVDTWSLVPVSDRQKGMIADKLGSIKQRSKRLNDLMRKDFEANERRLIREWEQQTGNAWPHGATPHHVIPIKNGGTNEWWNLTPVKHPHTGTIHGTGSALRQELPYSKPPGTITKLEGWP